MKNIAIIILLAAIYFPARAQDMSSGNRQAGDTILGVWQTADQKAQITITRKDSLY